MKILATVQAQDGVQLICVHRGEWDGRRPALVMNRPPDAAEQRVMKHIRGFQFTPTYDGWYESSLGDYVWIPVLRPGGEKYLRIARVEHLGDVGLIRASDWDGSYPAFHVFAGLSRPDQLATPIWDDGRSWKPESQGNRGGSHVWVPLEPQIPAVPVKALEFRQLPAQPGPAIVSTRWAHEQMVFRKCEHDDELVLLGRECDVCDKRAKLVDRIKEGPLTLAEQLAWSVELRRRLEERERQRREAIGCQGSLPCDLLGYDT